MRNLGKEQRCWEKVKGSRNRKARKGEVRKQGKKNEGKERRRKIKEGLQNGTREDDGTREMT